MANASKSNTRTVHARGIEQIAEALGDMGELLTETVGRARSRNRQHSCPNCGA